ncbi:hypothetical protein BAUCODRAFT_146417 [Baudoinia panamericana UAMH 10762]|uniref:Uncharacterized protein n=1 Tax=Baudoinia panamericana (strain UAMH 10762) TaxID=717646 RepID=M2NFL8_BAUPA|nr:uncharacterized protein BAUCODRAFT_146417 [Baudoinia panamericana UAMH 10762]EMC97800.1 hypothetical protein BAUCODRAFT_146417 [Baudoinia panamericana UAMH 10762]
MAWRTISTSRDSSFTYIHLQASHHADLLESFTGSSSKLPAEDILVAPQHQPNSAEDDDDVVPDQHAAFGIQRATQRQSQPAWRDLGLEALMQGGPPTRSGGQANRGAERGNVGSMVALR